MAPEKEYDKEPGGGLIGQAGATGQAEELAGYTYQTMDSAVQDSIRRTEKTVGEAVQSIADGIETSAEYLSERGMAGIVESAETLIRRYPFQTLLIGFSLGYLFTRSGQR